MGRPLLRTLQCIACRMTNPMHGFGKIGEFIQCLRLRDLIEELSEIVHDSESVKIVVFDRIQHMPNADGKPAAEEVKLLLIQSFTSTGRFNLVNRGA